MYFIPNELVRRLLFDAYVDVAVSAVIQHGSNPVGISNLIAGRLGRKIENPVRIGPAEQHAVVVAAAAVGHGCVAIGGGSGVVGDGNRVHTTGDRRAEAVRYLELDRDSAAFLDDGAEAFTQRRAKSAKAINHLRCNFHIHRTGHAGKSWAAGDVARTGIVGGS